MRLHFNSDMFIVQYDFPQDVLNVEPDDSRK